MKELEKIKQEAKHANGYALFKTNGEKAIAFEDGFIAGATKYAELLEQEKAKGEKMAEALGQMVFMFDRGLHPDSIGASQIESVKQLLTEYKTTSK